MTKASMLGNRRRLRRHSCLSGGHASAEAVALSAVTSGICLSQLWFVQAQGAGLIGSLHVGGCGDNRADFASAEAVASSYSGTLTTVSTSL